MEQLRLHTDLLSYCHTVLLNCSGSSCYAVLVKWRGRKLFVRQMRTEDECVHNRSTQQMRIA